MLPITILIVDDSEAVLAHATSVLSGDYTVATALNGHEGLEKLRELRPALMVLDLSMPELSGDEVLARVRAGSDAQLRVTPIIIVSSEETRGQACLAAGAQAFLAKPVRADALRAAIAAALEAAQARRSAGATQVLLAEVGARRVAITLSQVRAVLLHPATRPLSVGPSYVTECVELPEARALVLDMARPLGVEHALPLWDRKLVVLEHEGVLLALSFDRVLDPIEIAAERRVPREGLVLDARLLGRAIGGAVLTDAGPVPLLDAAGLFSRAALRRLAPALDALARQEGA